MERLQKRIATSGYCSRRKAEELIQKGLVEVNGEVITKLGTTVKPGDIITVEGNILDNSKAYEYYLLNKPKGVVTTTNDEKGRNTVIDLIETNTRIYPVGRLDYDTTGALILTNDGNLANLLMRPDSQSNGSKHHSKEQQNSKSKRNSSNTRYSKIKKWYHYRWSKNKKSKC